MLSVTTVRLWIRLAAFARDRPVRPAPMKTMLFGFITGYATNYYLNLSLFFAFALIFPDFQLMLFFILPVKVKYLALLDAIGFLWMLLTAGWPQKIALLVAVGNILLFFWKDFKNNINNWYRRYKFRRDLNNNRYR